MSFVFVSHNSKDEAFTLSICDALTLAGISTWISFRDIPAGANWDESIESALKAAYAVVVVVSPHSVESRYVRAEVERAIQYQKTVIPVLARPSDIPLRWRTLQYVKWYPKNSSESVAKIIQGLPRVAAIELREALNDPSRFDDVRSIILRHKEWLPLEFQMANFYKYEINAKISRGLIADCFAGRLDTSGPRAFLYYLGDPYYPPVDSAGVLSPDFQRLLEKMVVHFLVLRSKMKPAHKLAPLKLFHDELWQWRKTFSYYRTLKVIFVIGRRHHFQQMSDAAQSRVFGEIDEINKKLFPHEDYDHGGCEVMSYDRILSAIPK